MAGQQVNVSTAKLGWTYTHTTGSQPTESRLKIGTVPGVYTIVKVYPFLQTREVNVRDVVPGVGQYYALTEQANPYGVWGVSPEIPFDAGSVGSGSTLLTIG